MDAALLDSGQVRHRRDDGFHYRPPEPVAWMVCDMQNIKGYSPLQAGVRFLPSTVVIILVAPIAGRL